MRAVLLGRLLVMVEDAFSRVVFLAPSTHGSSGHHFTSALLCKDCGISWNEHQVGPTVCGSEHSADVWLDKPIPVSPHLDVEHDRYAIRCATPHVCGVELSEFDDGEFDQEAEERQFRLQVWNPQELPRLRVSRAWGRESRM